jgi:molecular chaperone Hsp33
MSLRDLPDQLLKATAAGGRIRAVALRSTNLVDEARRRHGMAPTATAALGRALTGSLMLAATLRKSGRLNVRVAGHGPLRGIFVDAGTDGTVRGYVGRPTLDLPPRADGQIDVGGAVGHEGILSVTYDLGRHPYTGTVSLVSGELGEDFTAYLANSEQIPSAVSLGIFVDHGEVITAGGLLVQLMPDAGDEIAERLEATISTMPSFTAMAREGLSLKAILERALTGFQVEILQEDNPVQFSCHCDRQRVLDAIRVLGEDEIRSMIAEDGQAEVRCHFCSEQYIVPKEQLERLVS